MAKKEVTAEAEVKMVPKHVAAELYNALDALMGSLVNVYGDADVVESRKKTAMKISADLLIKHSKLVE